MSQPAVIFGESTVPVGTAERLRQATLLALGTARDGERPAVMAREIYAASARFGHSVGSEAAIQAHLSDLYQGQMRGGE